MHLKKKNENEKRHSKQPKTNERKKRVGIFICEACRTENQTRITMKNYDNFPSTWEIN